MNRYTILACAVAAAAFAGSAGTAVADDRICRGAIGSTTVDDNIRVPQGATCRLTRTRVEGNVLVSRGALW
jgi:hypothetical protein